MKKKRTAKYIFRLLLSFILIATMSTASIGVACAEDVTELSDPESSDVQYEIEVSSDPQDLAVEEKDINKRVILFADQGVLIDTYGATQAVYYPYAGDYILDYESVAAARAGYQTLVRDFGEENVLIDFPIYSEADKYSQTDAVSESWGIDMMHLDTVRDKANNDKSITQKITVAVLDTGIYRGHEKFSGRLDAAAASFLGEGGYPTDNNGHGTHVAGIIADGTSDLVNILPVKVLGDDGKGGFAEMINGIYYATEHGADVINLSLANNLSDSGMYWTDTAYVQAEKALANAESVGCICVAAAGNDSMNIDTVATYPAISEHTVAVSSINKGSRRATSSNYGNSVVFCAPGDAISSAGISNSTGYIEKSGTSMAAPHVSAAFAMIELYNKGIKAEDAREAMQAIAVDLGDAGRDKFFGYGLPVFSDDKVPMVENGKSDSGDKVSDSSQNSGSGTNPDSSQQSASSSKSTVAKASEQISPGMPKVTIKKIKRGKGKASITWKKAKGKYTGYQIQISPSKSFKSEVRTVNAGKKTTKKTVKKLKKGKKYYFRMRTYKTVNGSKVYSNWSKSKSIKIKK